MLLALGCAGIGKETGFTVFTELQFDQLIVCPEKYLHRFGVLLLDLLCSRFPWQNFGLDI